MRSLWATGPADWARRDPSPGPGTARLSTRPTTVTVSCRLERDGTPGNRSRSAGKRVPSRDQPALRGRSSDRTLQRGQYLKAGAPPVAAIIKQKLAVRVQVPDHADSLKSAAPGRPLAVPSGITRSAPAANRSYSAWRSSPRFHCQRPRKKKATHSRTVRAVKNHDGANTREPIGIRMDTPFARGL